MNIERYKELKAKGLVRTVVVGEQKSIVANKYDEATGDKVIDEVITINPNAVIEQYKNAKAFLESIQEVAKDFGISLPAAILKP